MQPRDETTPLEKVKLEEKTDAPRETKCDYYSKQALKLYCWLSGAKEKIKKRDFFKDAIQVPVDPNYGLLLTACQLDGKGLGIILKDLVQALEGELPQHKGRCVGYFGPQAFLVVTEPKDIQRVLEEVRKNDTHHDSLQQFTRIFGPDNIFSHKTKSPEYRADKERFKTLLFDEATLDFDKKPMGEFTRTFLDKIKDAKGQGLSITHIAKAFTIGILGKTKLGLENLSDEVISRISKNISKGAMELGNQTNNFFSRTIPYSRPEAARESRCALITNQIPRLFNYFFDARLQTLVKNGDTFLKKLSAENKTTMLEPRKWLTIDKNPEEIKKIDVTSEDSINKTKLLLVVGHDTTAVLVEFCLRYLAAHPHFITLLRERLESKQIDPLAPSSIKDYDDPLLIAIIMETLRLAPPVPIMVNQIKKRCKLREEDKDYLNPGDIVLFSQYLTHRKKSIWGQDANSFNPFRFINNEKIHMPDPHEFFPFGSFPRFCLGQRTALLNTKIFIASLVLEFDFRFASKDMLNHYEKTDVIFTLKAAEDLLMEFIPRATQPKVTQHQEEDEEGLRYRVRH